MKIKIINKFNYLDIKENKTNLVLGFFDGIHEGHMKLILEAMYGYRNVSILTFIHSFKNDDEVIMSNKQKEEIFKEIGISTIYYLDYDEYLKNMEPIDFINLILKRINPHQIICGSDYRFGKNALGDIYLLKKEFPSLNVVPFVYFSFNKQMKVSSTVIKDLIKVGKIKEANEYLYQDYEIEGEVVKGLGNGSKLLFPTINLKLTTNYVLPKNGVYKTKVYLNDLVYDSITNVGIHPTIDKLNEVSIETHILNFNKDIYGKFVRIRFMDFIRDEKKFNSIEELKKQIQLDIKRI